MALALALGVLLPPLNEIYPNANILAPIMSAGIIVGTLIFGPVMDKFGYKCLLISGAAVLFFLTSSLKKRIFYKRFIINYL